MVLGERLSKGPHLLKFLSQAHEFFPYVSQKIMALQ